MPTEIVPLFNRLAELAIKMGRVTNHKKREAAIIMLSGEFDIFSALMQGIVPALLGVEQGAAPNNALYTLIEYMMFGTMPSESGSGSDEKDTGTSSASNN